MEQSQSQSPEPAVDLLDALGIAEGPAEPHPLGGDGLHRGIIRPTKSMGRAALRAGSMSVKREGSFFRDRD